MKKRLTRFLPFLLAFTIALPSYSVFAEEENQAKETQTNETNKTQADETTANDTLSLAAETAVLIDAASGEILYDKDADKKMYPASITKLMTILLALENGKLTDEITFSHDAVYNIEPGSAHIAILEGETLTLEQGTAVANYSAFRKRSLQRRSGICGRLCGGICQAHDGAGEGARLYKYKFCQR